MTVRYKNNILLILYLPLKHNVSIVAIQFYLNNHKNGDLMIIVKFCKFLYLLVLVFKIKSHYLGLEQQKRRIWSQEPVWQGLVTGTTFSWKVWMLLQCMTIFNCSVVPLQCYATVFLLIKVVCLKAIVVWPNKPDKMPNII